MNIIRAVEIIQIVLIMVIIVLLSGIPKEKIKKFDESDEGKKLKKAFNIQCTILTILFATYVVLGFLSIIGIFFNLGATTGNSSFAFLMYPVELWKYMLEITASPFGSLIEICIITVPFIVIYFIKYIKIKNMKED